MMSASVSEVCVPDSGLWRAAELDGFSVGVVFSAPPPPDPLGVEALLSLGMKLLFSSC